MEKIINLITPYLTLIKILAVIGALAGAGWGLKKLHDHIDQGGYDRALSEISAQQQANNVASRTEVIKIGEKNDDDKKQNRSTPGYDGPVSPVVAGAIDRLH